MLVTVGLCVSSLLGARTLEGVVTDLRTGSPLIGSYITVKGMPEVKTTTGLDGSFELKGLPEGRDYVLVCRSMSYKTKEVTVNTTELKVTIPMEEESTALQGVTVTGSREHHSDRSAITLEKNSDNVLNVMSAQSIRLSPDVNVASVLQRVSGVTMEKDASGEATYAILRGMDKRYNYTLVNGVKIPSPDDKNRYVPLNIFPVT